jgi:hypothetical protein
VKVILKEVFSGFRNRDTVIELANGKIFKQVEYKYEYKYQYQPKVKVFQEGSVYYIEVEEMNGRVKV